VSPDGTPMKRPARIRPAIGYDEGSAARKLNRPRWNAAVTSAPISLVRPARACLDAATKPAEPATKWRLRGSEKYNCPTLAEYETDTEQTLVDTDRVEVGMVTDPIGALTCSPACNQSTAPRGTNVPGDRCASTRRSRASGGLSRYSNSFVEGEVKNAHEGRASNGGSDAHFVDCLWL